MEWKGWSWPRLCCADLNNHGNRPCYGKTGSAHFLTCAGNIGRSTVKFPFIYFETPPSPSEPRGRTKFHSQLFIQLAYSLHRSLTSPYSGPVSRDTKMCNTGVSPSKVKGRVSPWLLSNGRLQSTLFKYTGLTTWQTCVCIPSLKLTVMPTLS